ncbi:hypothetical protein DBV15_05672 [Temnothorax longispinosus]|uniref:Uncharacterized protein n=1 Tax=Temnothorax longispinosus TaxID=300112 RepID=A0A4S2JPC3_9HYME|nr:hypothetical protein DBV15_05672 [Temnothorax longispinosus]
MNTQNSPLSVKQLDFSWFRRIAPRPEEALGANSERPLALTEAVRRSRPIEDHENRSPNPHSINSDNRQTVLSSLRLFRELLSRQLPTVPSLLQCPESKREFCTLSFSDSRSPRPTVRPGDPVQKILHSSKHSAALYRVIGRSLYCDHTLVKRSD